MIIILYGGISSKKNFKYQRMIDGNATCGYREYAKNYGHIIYMSPQNIKQLWEHSILKPKDVIAFIKKYPHSIVWSVKHDPQKDTKILLNIDNKKIYYSCNSKNMYNKSCDVSLVDTKHRVKKNAKLWFKGKDPNYWKPSSQKKEFDYLLIGRRADKNELYFLRKLNEVKEERKILWIGGNKHINKITTNHKVTCTDFVSQDEVRRLIPSAKVGILFTELKVEGFPQTFLEMTMCGVPVVYNKNAPKNEFYFHNDNCLLSSKKNIVKSAEILLKNGDPIKCRETAIRNYSLDKSYKKVLKCLKL